MGISSSRHSYNADLYHQPSRRIKARIDANIPIFVSITLLSFIEIINFSCFVYQKYIIEQNQNFETCVYLIVVITIYIIVT